jgi:phospholipase A1
MLRNNLRDDNRGAVELSYSFPIRHTRLKGYLKYFNGYGESLIDYNHRIQSFGVGFLLSDWLPKPTANRSE